MAVSSETLADITLAAEHSHTRTAAVGLVLIQAVHAGALDLPRKPDGWLLQGKGWEGPIMTRDCRPVLLTSTGDLVTSNDRGGWITLQRRRRRHCDAPTSPVAAGGLDTEALGRIVALAGETLLRLGVPLPATIEASYREVTRPQPAEAHHTAPSAGNDGSSPETLADITMAAERKHAQAEAAGLVLIQAVQAGALDLPRKPDGWGLSAMDEKQPIMTRGRHPVLLTGTGDLITSNYRKSPAADLAAFMLGAWGVPGATVAFIVLVIGPHLHNPSGLLLLSLFAVIAISIAAGVVAWCWLDRGWATLQRWYRRHQNAMTSPVAAGDLDTETIDRIVILARETLACLKVPLPAALEAL